MKKTLLILALVLMGTMIMTSCKNEKKDNEKQEIKEEVTTETVYQCPMDCEHGKTYTEPGKCPVCKMDLKAKKVEAGINHKHAQACKCMEYGEKCNCQKGKCKCSAKEKENMTTVCKKCGDKNCTCDMKKA